jgi:cell division protease FtsH
MVTEFGMSKKLGPIRYAVVTGSYLQSGVSGRNDLSPETISSIDEEIRIFVNKAVETATSILNEHIDILHEVARVLQDKEVLSGDEMARIAEASLAAASASEQG